MRKLLWHSSFRRAFKRLMRVDRRLAGRVLDVIEGVVVDPFEERFRVHKLHGALDGLWAAWVEYDCRIVSSFEANPGGGEDMIVLVDLGSHDEVY